MTSSDAVAPFLKDPYILDLFAGPGGLDVAAQMLGAKSLGIEWSKDACETRYRAGLETWHADVSAVRRDRFHELPSELNVLAGGPPCQTYSVAGNGLGRKALDKVEKILHALMERVSDEEIDKRLEELGDDRRTALVLEPIRYAIKALSCPKRDERPFDVIVLEQVPQVKALWGVYKDALAAGLPGKGEARVKYEVAEVATLHTEAYGVPQTRRRTILIARLAKHGAPRLPLPTHHIYNPHKPERGGPGDKKAMAQAGQTVLSVDGGQAQVRPWVTMGEVLDRKAPFQVRSNYGSGGDPKKRGIRTDLQPSFTVTGKVSRNAVQHANGTPHTPDRLTIPEAGILQTFPPNYPWWGGDRSQQVGNAVPPLFGMHVLAAALSLPLPPEEKLRESWPETDEAVRSRLRKEGCGVPDKCGPDCPKPEDQSSPPASSDSSRPRTIASAKRSAK
ncbi:DNA (cytosine-5)-methyltransferase 1 [Kitasatospora sp. GP30]|uniref:DNA cytosine methyltransferase n=1 Tax=Kitasatospora sp. GP30 TaxID=3035084 RepID=UPI000C715934|nr:DNA cytosine methyltransferase [Kitasatospora sp. GP30]MDH6140459.1 DNA (cytosine-5)-methyltransferase 1 [Kitasatospora sp. GP30]